MRHKVALGVTRELTIIQLQMGRMNTTKRGESDDRRTTAMRLTSLNA
jgi:hypothetical protein